LSDIAGLAGVIALNPPLDWPFEELALPDNLPKARVPIFLFFDESKRVVLDSLNKLIKSHAIPAKISLLPESEFNSEFVNKIMAIDIIIVFAMHLQKILSSPDR
ncbi:MAG: hypothetical protein LBM70_09030, partial [Victivallales bacterium]|jgi:hypothetical protein|nr:hypothetical protein [Victivallales bacterium]